MAAKWFNSLDNNSDPGSNGSSIYREYNPFLWLLFMYPKVLLTNSFVRFLGESKDTKKSFWKKPLYIEKKSKITLENFLLIPEETVLSLD